MNNPRTILQKFDPRTKFFVLVCAGATVLLSATFHALAFGTLLVAAGIVGSPISLREILRRMKAVLWFALIITVVNATAVSGSVVAEIAGVYMTREGLLAGIALSYRIVLLLLFSVLFVRTTPIADFTDGVENSLAPFRKYFGPVIAVLGMTLNFAPLLVQSAQRLKAAQIARGADASSSFLSQVRFASQAVVPLFVSAVRSAHHLAEAMDARCYDPSALRTPLRATQPTIADGVLITSVLLIAAAILFAL